MGSYAYNEPYYSTTKQQQHHVPVQVVTRAQARPWFDPWYLATIQGGMKMLQILGGGGAVVASLLINGAFFGTYIATTVTLAGFGCSLVLLIMHVYNLINLVTFIDMVFWEFVYTACGIGGFLVSSAIMIYSAFQWENYRLQWGAAGLFCVIGAVAFTVDFLIQLRARRNGRNTNASQTSGYRTTVAS